MPRAAIRNNHGGAILVEGVVGLIMVIFGMILAGVLLLNVAGASYHQEKIGYVTNETALYAATLPNNGSRQALVTTQVGNLLTGAGYSPANTTVTITDLTVASGKPAVKVTLSTPVPTMLSINFTNFMPAQLQITDTAVAVDPRYFWAYGADTFPDTQKATGGLLNATGALPADNLPAYNLSLTGITKVR